MKFTLEAQSGKARAATIQTEHSTIQTPVFMPVGTVGSIKSLDMYDMDEILGAQIILANTYHMYLRPGDENVAKMGKLHKYTTFPKSFLTDSGGFKEVIVMVKGKGAYSYLKYESGTHRVQRVPTTETQGRIHTSAVTVAVLPEVEDVEVHIEPNDLKIDVFRSSGPGGQSVNTTDSAIRITHLPSGLVVICQDQKSQHKNKEKAFRVLRSRLYEMELAKKNAEDALKRGSMVTSGDRSAKIRTYNYSQGRVTDHRIGLTLYDLSNIVNGDIQRIIDELQLAENTEKLKANNDVI